MTFKNNKLVGALVVAILVCVAVGIYTGYARADGPAKGAAQPARNPDVVVLTQDQAAHIPVVQVALHSFVVRTDAVGTIDFDGDTMAMVSSPYTGRIDRVLVKAGDAVVKGQTLFTIESPDLVQADSAAISAAGTAMVAKNALERARELVESRGLAQKDYDQAVADDQSAEAALRAARDALRIFGRSEHEIDQIIATHKVDSEMLVRSPISGVVTARNAAPGDLVQPGSTPYPMVVADTSVKWMLANVSESDIPGVALGQPVEVRIDAYPGKAYVGKVENISAGLDPNSHRALVRASIRDPKNELKAQMFATFKISKSQPVQSPSIPVNGVVREGDGSYTVWVTADHRQFTLRRVTIGLIGDGQQQILSGVDVGESVAGDGALFLSNARILNQQ